MKLSDFHFDLPEEQIASFPPANRTDSRLLCLDKVGGGISHHRFPDLLNMLNPGDLMVFNNTRVIPARLFGRKASGGQVEVLLERVTGEGSAIAQIRASKSPKILQPGIFHTGHETCRKHWPHAIATLYQT